MKRKLLTLISVLTVMVPTFMFTAEATGEMPDRNTYIYSNDKQVIASPEAYTVKCVVDPAKLGTKSIASLQDIAVDTDGNLYMLDSEQNRLLVLDSSYKLKSIITEFTANGSVEVFAEPMGVSVGRDGLIYIADTGNGRIVVFDKNLNWKKTLNEPDKESTLYDYDYKPIKVDADSGGRIYVIAESQTQGILQFDSNGDFLGYLGATKVVPNFKELFFRAFASKEQLKGMLRSIPTEYNNLFIDEENFVYCTISAISNSDVASTIENNSDLVTPVRLLNQNGNDVLKRDGNYPPVGDLQFFKDGRSYGGASAFTDVAAGSYGTYSVLDSLRGHIFTYNDHGELMYIFGGRGESKGEFITPTAIAYSGQNILVADKNNGTVQVFEPTEYAQKLNEALTLYNNGEYSAEQSLWEELLEMYGGNPLIYSGVGRVLYNQKSYREAMTCFKQANNKEYYSKALKKYVSEIGVWVLAAIIVTAVAVAVILLILKKCAKKENRSSLFSRIGYAKYIAVHPFGGFWDMIHEGRGSVKSATVLLIIAILVNVLRICFTPYLFQGDDWAESNILIEGILGIALPLGLWCVANWCLTSLMDGKGTMKHIYMFSCYSLWPLIIMYPLITAVSWILSIDSASFITILSAVALVWTFFLFFAGTLTIHQYSAGKTVLTIILSLIGMMILIFLAILIMSLCQQIIVFFELLIREQTMRL